MPIDFPNSPATGQLYQSGDKTWRYDGEKWTIYATIVVVDSTPIGSIQAFAGSTAPTGWMLAYGQAISRVTFADLFTVIGTTYGVGDGSTTFNLPDLRGRTIAGLDNMGGSAASRLTSTTITGGADAVGEVGGAQTHLLSSLESGLPTHIHDNTATFSGTPASHSHTQDSHSHMVNEIAHPWATQTASGFRLDVVTSVLNGGWTNMTSAQPAIQSTSITPAGTVSMTNAINSSANASQAHNNVQPTMVLNYLIKYGPSSTVNVVDDQFMLPAQIFS